MVVLTIVGGTKLLTESEKIVGIDRKIRCSFRGFNWKDHNLIICLNNIEAITFGNDIYRSIFDQKTTCDSL